MKETKTLNFIHYGCHHKANLNSGDTLLFQIVRDLFDSQADQKINWNLKQIWDEVTERDIDEINNQSDAIIIGGGGVFLKDQQGSDANNSGWQWNCKVDLIAKIKVPIIMFAVGYNRFRGQEEFNQNFSKSLIEISKKSPFFSLRNNGSIEAIKPYIKNDNIDYSNIFRQFCPTTIINKIPQHANKEKEKVLDKKILSFNAAFDRTSMRSLNPKKMYNNTCLAIKEAVNRDWQIVACSHKFMDKEIESYLKKHNISYEARDLTEASPQEIIDHYSSVDLSVGMRGHSQLIPFGLNKFIFSFISHDKLSFFLEDLNLTDMGSEIDSPRFINDFATFLDMLDQDPSEILDRLKQAQNYVWDETLNNFKIIGEVIEHL